MIIFTSICANYLHKARTLAKSVKGNMPNAKFVVCLLEKEIKPEYEYVFFDRIVLAKDSWNGDFNRFIFKHSIVEAATSVKGRFFQFLYEEYPQEEALIYLDPDIFVYDDFTELSYILKTRPIVLCPHLLIPGNIDMELSSTAHGVYNLGFLAVNYSEEAKSFINWWTERLYLFCYDDILRGIFTDQKWVDLAPCFFDVEIFKHHGYDFATWSLLNCDITKKGQKYFISGDPLRFIHFSGYGSTVEKCMNDWLPKGEHLFKDLYREYSKLHDANDAENISKTPWSYGFYESGEKIDDELRIIYRNNYDIMFSIGDPFALSNHMLSLKLKKTVQNKLSVLFYKLMKSLKTNGLLKTTKKILKKLFHS